MLKAPPHARCSSAVSPKASSSRQVAMSGSALPRITPKSVSAFWVPKTNWFAGTAPGKSRARVSVKVTAAASCWMGCLVGDARTDIASMMIEGLVSAT